MRPRTRSAQRGHGLTEFALVAPLFLALAIGVIDWSYTMFAQQTLMSRTARAARWAAPRPLNEATVAAAKNIILYGAIECSQCESFLGLKPTDIAIQQLPSTQTIVNGVATTTSTLQVRVTGYKILHFAPFNQASVEGRPIVAAHVWECLDSNCSVE